MTTQKATASSLSATPTTQEASCLDTYSFHSNQLRNNSGIRYAGPSGRAMRRACACTQWNLASYLYRVINESLCRQKFAPLISGHSLRMQYLSWGVCMTWQRSMMTGVRMTGVIMKSKDHYASLAEIFVRSNWTTLYEIDNKLDRSCQ